VEGKQVKYVPLQAREGGLPIFLLSGATEIMYRGEKYFIVPHRSNINAGKRKIYRVCTC
jgi:hypothetical protein